MPPTTYECLDQLIESQNNGVTRLAQRARWRLDKKKIRNSLFYIRKNCFIQANDISITNSIDFDRNIELYKNRSSTRNKCFLWELPSNLRHTVLKSKRVQYRNNLLIKIHYIVYNAESTVSTSCHSTTSWPSWPWNGQEPRIIIFLPLYICHDYRSIILNSVLAIHEISS